MLKKNDIWLKNEEFTHALLHIIVDKFLPDELYVIFLYQKGHVIDLKGAWSAREWDNFAIRGGLGITHTY